MFTVSYLTTNAVYNYVQAAYKLLEVFGKLQDLGHPELSQKTFTYTCSCSALIKQEVCNNTIIYIHAMMSYLYL